VAELHLGRVGAQAVLVIAAAGAQLAGE
jgi:hypothetical protein